MLAAALWGCGGLPTSWVSTVATIDACGHSEVSFHLATPGAWRGTIRVSSDLHESTQVSWDNERESGDSSHDRHVDITDSFYLGGEDTPGTLAVQFTGRQYTQGAGYWHDTYESVGHIPNAVCDRDVHKATDFGGGWFFDADASAFLDIQPDGNYTITFFATMPPDEVEWQGESVEVIEQTGTDPTCVPTATIDTPGPVPAGDVVATPPGLVLEGRVDLENPATSLTGPMTVEDPYRPFTTTITWNLNHDGPIRMVQP